MYWLSGRYVFLMLSLVSGILLSAQKSDWAWNRSWQSGIPEIELSHGINGLRNQFVSDYSKSPKSVSFPSNIDGPENVWAGFFDQNFVIFNRLQDYRYRFLIRALRGELDLNKTPATFDVIIRKPFWKHWTADFLVIIPLVIIIAIIVQTRERLLRKEKLLLEKAEKERTDEIIHQKDQIAQQRDAIELQKQKIEEINKNLGDSINYARRIQNAVFPPVRLLNELFPDNFLLFLPQQIVSGDFFWVTYYQGKKIVTVSDCTGHGVPGAFMSMLGITMLNELVHSMGITEPSEILNQLKNDIIRALRQEETEVIAGDGMEMALCVYDPVTSVLQYAGAFNPLVILRGGKLQVIDPDPMPVGLGAIREVKFNQHEFKMSKGDVIYLFSDGYADQFGGARSKKFSRRRFLEMLQEIHTLPMNTQKQNLTKTLQEWMKEEQQIDDITVMGIRF